MSYLFFSFFSRPVERWELLLCQTHKAKNECDFCLREFFQKHEKYFSRLSFSFSLHLLVDVVVSLSMMIALRIVDGMLSMGMVSANIFRTCTTPLYHLPLTFSNVILLIKIADNVVLLLLVFFADFFRYVWVVNTTVIAFIYTHATFYLLYINQQPCNCSHPLLDVSMLVSCRFWICSPCLDHALTAFDIAALLHSCILFRVSLLIIHSRSSSSPCYWPHFSIDWWWFRDRSGHSTVIIGSICDFVAFFCIFWPRPLKKRKKNDFSKKRFFAFTQKRVFCCFFKTRLF